MELETAVERLYTDESLAADVDDKTAVPLLKWAESVLPVLVARGDEGFDDAFMTLKKLIKSVARLIDMRGEIDMTERAERADKIQGFAQELGIIVNIDHLESLASFEGPELVAQMVGPVAAFSAPTPIPLEAQTSSAEVANDEQATTTSDVLQEQATSASSAQTEPRAADSEVTDRVMPEIAPDNQVKAWFLESNTAMTDEPVQPTENNPQDQANKPVEKPSLLDGIGAFFQRVTERLDDKKNTDQPDDKE